ncbi:MAG: zinc-dependent alcohol dehydrogenase [Chloroflexota bacterium]
MLAARLYGARDVRVERVPLPVPATGETLVRLRAISVCGSDLHYYRDGHIGDSQASAPLVLGHELSGEVADGGQLVAIDPNISCEACERCREGNPNLCPRVRFAGTPPTDGGLREYLSWPTHLLHPLPAGMTPEMGALLEPLGVAIHAIDLARVRLADTVAVLGTGTIGLLCVRLAALSGAVRIYATDLMPARLNAARAFGAHAAIDPSAVDPVRAIVDATGGQGVDVVIECAGAPDTPDHAMRVVRPGGTVVLVGIPSNDRTGFPASQARRKGVTIKLARRMKHAYPRAIALARAGLVDLPQLVTHRFPLAQAAFAFAALDRDQTIVKALIEV